MEARHEIAIVIPVFNAESCLKELVTEIIRVLTVSGRSFEIILVDDGSKDKSWQIIKELKKSDSRVTGFLLGKNFGQHKATQCGLAHADAEWIVTMDDDFEHSPDQIIPLIEKAKAANTDLFYAVPTKSQKGISRSLASRLFKFLSKIENAEAGKGSSFRVINGHIGKNLQNHQSHLFFLDEILLWYTDNTGHTTIDFLPSKKPVSGYNYPKLFFLSKDVWMISTTMPLKIVKFLGISMSGISFIFGVYHLLHKLFFYTRQGYTSLIISILFSTGLILLCIGIIGEYLSNLVIMQNKKPGYSVREKA